MCETFPPNQREACDIPRASIKVGAENRLRFIHGGYLYEVTTYKELDTWLGSIMQAWKFI